MKLNQVTKSFVGTGQTVGPLDLEIPLGQFVSFLGPSGCGKSTLLRIVAGLEQADGGSIVRDQSVNVACVFQEPLLLPWRTAVENVVLPLELEGKFSKDERFERALKALASVGLGADSAKMPHQLSGGMKMRTSLARALVTNPDLLLLDEPFSALDEITRFQLQEDLRRFWQTTKMTIIFVTHSMSEAAFLADRQVVFSNRPARILADRNSSLPPQRDRHTRLSLAFASEVQELQEGFKK